MSARRTSARRPLYLNLAEQLAADIGAGVFALGALLPTEAELCARHTLSRHTVREAIRRLEEAGLVARQHGIGTRVLRVQATPRYVQTLAGVSDLWQYVKDTRRTTLAIRDVLPGDARVPLPAAAECATRPWRMLEGLRLLDASDEPVSWTQVYVHPNYADVLDEVDAQSVPVYSLIEARHGLRASRLLQEITALAIDPAVAALLKVAPGSPGLAIVRHYLGSDGVSFEVTLSIHPAERYRYSMQLDLAYGAQISP